VPLSNRGISMRSSLALVRACQANSDGAHSGPMQRGKHQAHLLELAGFCVPPLTLDASKGGAGRVAVVGGSEEYTGAPYFAAASALRSGVDLAHVFCEKSAGTAIKSYSPELIVHPLLSVASSGIPQADSVKAVGEWIPRLEGILFGPGLGRDEQIVATCAVLITQAATLRKPLVLDADGLFILTSAYRWGRGKEVFDTMREALGDAPLTITPNKVEFERLCKALELVKEGESAFDQAEVLAPKVAAAVGRHTVIVVKGAKDIISDGTSTVWCDEVGSPRRCGGQGDVLAGLLLAFRTWTHLAVEKQAGADHTMSHALYGKMQVAGSMAACTVARRCANKAFARRRRAMLAGDLLEELGPEFDALFPAEDPDLLRRSSHESESAGQSQGSGSKNSAASQRAASGGSLDGLGSAPKVDWQEDWNKETKLF